MIPQNTPKLNPNQEAAVKAPEGPLLIVAGAGTGKTKTLTERILDLISRGVHPERILALTFTNKAAKEMKDRVGARLEHGKGEPWVGTFHALGARILRKEARHLARTPDFAIYDDHDATSLMEKVMEANGISARVPKKGKAGAASWLSVIGGIKNGMRPFPDQDSKEGLAYRAYEEGMITHNAFDFDDLVEKVVILFRKFPDVREKYAGMYDHVLIDEYQDINPIQYALVRLISMGHQNVSAVGDFRQSIYRWRGSDPSIFERFEEDWPGAKIITLSENYRSSAPILDAASALIEKMNHRYAGPLTSAMGEGDRVLLVETGSEEEESAWIAETIREGMRRKDEGTVAILYRTNAQSRAVEDALIEYGIPYDVYGGLKFYERKEIKDIVAGLRMAVNEKDRISENRLEKISKTKTKAYKEIVAAHPTKNPQELIRIFLEAFRYQEILEKGTNLEDRRENIETMKKFAEGFDDAALFVERIALLQATDAITEGKAKPRARITLMTMHLAKGLEFDTVFVVGVQEGLMPHIRSTTDEDEMNEERRLLYVAMTRARHTLIMSFSGIPSRFLGEIPTNLMTYESRDGKQETYDPDDEYRYISID
jgi:DNA helicase-2/ATP-dependent DNA helicase PcrA